MRSFCIVIVVIAQSWQGPLWDVRFRRSQDQLTVVEEVFKATVTAIEDGDSVVVTTGNERSTLHLAGVDAPELSQAGGPEAKAFLSDLVLGKAVTVRLKNASERSATIELNGSDLSAALIRNGMAWHCPRFTADRELTSAEADARKAKRGLWNVARPTPPWLFRGAGACWQQQKKGVAQDRPDFSGMWTAVSPPEQAGQKLTIKQEAASLTMERPFEGGVHSVLYKLDGTTSRTLTMAHGPVDIVAKTRWGNRSLIIEERQWMARGEEATHLRQVLWLDERGLLNLEVSSPRPIGENDVMRLVLRRTSSHETGGAR